MKPVNFELAQPATIECVLELLSDRDRESVLLAGGQSLMPLLNLRLSAPDVVIDLNNVPGLSDIRDVNGHIYTGGMCRQYLVESNSEIASGLPVLPWIVKKIGFRTIRNRGTIGGSMAHADPAAELPALAVAMDSLIELRSLRGMRHVKASEFFRGYMDTAIAEDELLIGVKWPRKYASAAFGVGELTRRAGDFAVAAVLVLARYKSFEDNRPEDVSVVAYGSLQRPTRVTEVERALKGVVWDSDVVAAAQHTMQEAIDPTDDISGSRDYKRALFGVMCKRGILQAKSQQEKGVVR